MNEIIPGAKPVPSTPIGLEVTAQRALLTQQGIISAREPVVTREERIVFIADDMVASGRWGEPRDIIAYLREVNGVPHGAQCDVVEHKDAATTGASITFTWWEIDALVPRQGTLS